MSIIFQQILFQLKFLQIKFKKKNIERSEILKRCFTYQGHMMAEVVEGVFHHL